MEPKKHKGHKGLKHKKEGGKVNKFNAVDAPEQREASEGDDGFKRGGHAMKKKHGGKAEGHKGHHRLDKMPRRAAGGSVKRAAGGQVMSTAHRVAAHEQGGAGNGHENLQSGDD